MTPEQKKIAHVPNPQEILEAQTEAGGWTRETLTSWGVEWPPPKGWRKRLENKSKTKKVVFRDS